MGDFDCIETGFNCEDETINFGSRYIAYDNLYEISTIACLKSIETETQTSKQLAVNSFLRSGKIIISTNRSLKIFQDIECTSLSFNLNLEFIIVSICGSSDGKYVLTCLENGSINVFDLDTCSCIFSGSMFSNLTEGECSFVKSFTEENAKHTTFITVLSNGNIFRVIITNNIKQDEEDGSQSVHMELLYDLKTLITTASMSCPFLLTDGTECCVLNIYTKTVVRDNCYYNLKVVSPFGNKFLGLDKIGNIIRICWLTLITFPVEYKYLLEDIFVIGDDQIITVTKKNEQGVSFLQLLKSDFIPIFSLNVSYPIVLINLENTSDDIIFISKILNDGSVSELRLQNVYETDIELKLKRLIKRQKFEEAEHFAKTFNINPVVILKAKAEFLVSKTECSTEEIDILIKLLDSIDDDCFKLNCCSNVDCSHLDDVRKILEYGVKIVPKSHNKDLKKMLAEMLIKFDTFMALSIQKDIESWSRFLTIDLVKEVKFFLQNFQIEDAIILYNRLDSKSVETSMNEENIEEILVILNNLPVNVYQPFLNTFVPITLSYKPSILSLFVRWLLNKILQLERRESSQFPENGLILADSILKLLKVDRNSCISFQRHRTLSKDTLNELSKIIEALKTLQQLKKKFGITVRLAEYLQGPKTFTKTLLCIIMSPEEYERFLKEFLCTYMLQNSLDVDTILYEEIKDLITYDDCCLSTVEVILKFIGSVQKKLQAVKEILECFPVPWNDIVRKMALESLHYSHPLTVKIKNTLEDEKIIIVLKNPKYKIKERQVMAIDEFQRIVKRIIFVNEPSLLDDIYNLCTTSKERVEATIILVKWFILKGNLDDSMNILDKCSQNEVHNCAQNLVDYVEILFNDKFVSSVVKENYYKVLRPLFRRLLDSCEDESEKENYQEKLNWLKGVFFINNTFNRSITTSDLREKSSRTSIFDQLVRESIFHLNMGSDIKELLQVSINLATSLSLEKDYVLIKLCEKLGKFEVILKAAEYLFEREANSKYLCLVAITLLKYLAPQEQLLATNSFNDSSEELRPVASYTILKDDKHLEENELYLYGLKFVQKIISKALVNGNAEDVFLIEETMSWLNVCYYFTREDNFLQEKVFKDIYAPTSCVPSFVVFQTLKDSLHSFLGFLVSYETPNHSYLAYLCNDIPQLTENQLLQQLSTLTGTIETFCREGLQLTAFKLLRTLQQRLSLILPPESPVMNFLHTLTTTKCLPLLLQAVISHKHIDTTLLYVLLLATGKDYIKYIQYYLKVYKRQSVKLYNLSAVGLKLLDFYNENQCRNVMLDSMITCKWWKKLKIEQELQYETFFKMSSANRLSMLVGFDCMNVELIKEYCVDYQLAPDIYYKSYLKSCLLNWKPEYEITTDLDGKKRLIIKTDENAILQKVQDVIKYIPDNTEVVPLLEKILNVANFYHYEIFICIFKVLTSYSQLLESRTVDIQMLSFLKNYRRFSDPSQREKEEWYTLFPDKQVDPFSKFRLPFSSLLFTSDVWSIIRPEINLKSYTFWFDVTNILQKNLKKDDICVYAIKQIVSSGILGDTVTKDWILFPKFEDLFIEVDECVKHISDLERATSVVYHLMNNTPNGADKVNAVRLSFKYATKYFEKFPKSPEVEKAFIKVKNKYFGFSATHILHKYNLADEKYIHLVTNPETLIETLYKDDRIIKQAESVNLNCPDINMAVYEISVLYGLDIHIIRYNLLNAWLSSSVVDIDFDSTMIFPNSCINDQMKIDDNDYGLKRAIYVCSNDKNDFWENYLLKVGLNDENVADFEQKSMSFKANALKCLCAINDEETVATLTKVSYTELLNYIDKLTLLSDLECLGISLNIETLDQYNKKDLLKRLGQIGKPLAVKVMGSLCMTYSMEENRYWDYIIDSSIKLEMINELKIYVDFLKKKYDQNYFLNAWQAIINHSFQQSAVSGVELEEIYINNFLMIQSSPVLFLLDFDKIIKQCIKSEKMEFAAVLLQYLPKEKRDLYIGDIIKTKNLISNLDKLDKKGIWGVKNVKVWFPNRRH